MSNAVNTEDRYRPETNQVPESESSSEGTDSGNLSLKNLRAAFRKFEESKADIVARITEIRRTAGNSAHEKAQAELELKDTREQLAESNRQLMIVQNELSSLKTELDSAKKLLDEIDKTLA